MKHFNWKKLLPLLAVLVFAIGIIALPAAVNTLPTHADFGDFAGDGDYGGDWGGGDYDYGGGDYDYGGGSSSSDDGFDLFWIFTIVYKLFGIPGVIILAIILIFFGRKLFGGSRNNQHPQQPRPAQPSGAQRTDASTLRNMAEYQQLDPQFSEAEFREKLSNLYVRFQNSWQAKNMEDLRPYLTDAMYAQFDRQLDNYRQNHQTNHVERISVLGVTLRGWKQESGKDVIVAELRTRIVDYVTDDNNGQLIRGSRAQEKFMTYEWTLMRTSGQTTDQTTGTTGQTCPHCGAHIDINHTAVCEYCGSVLTTDTFDWVVTSIKGISQQTR
ncbi:MAG: Tim44 domain-containing protein [Oscillospiraceae bacterium]|nr:Tim44 domain-containing protein [Oscillospiraceae bacterium]